MEALSYQTEALKKTLLANREAHRNLFEKALEGWKEQAYERVTALANELAANKVPELVISLPAPQDRTADYDRVIRMLEMTTHVEIELEEHDFAQYVMDDWGWKQQWTTSNSRYM